ncbi:MAG TPA: AgmX/PglI C-terminal domain-containing protein [Kofleriaceae bacterium]|nr:AgmX/PglI C-terminal domain-containing protein [Kofleriaceae bacterium]
MAGGKTPLTFRLYKGDEFLREEKLALPVIKVGKLSSSHLRLEDKNVSRMHALIEVTGPGDVSIIDLSSTTGTFVNGQKVNKAKLQSGDTVVIGETRIEITIGGDDAEDDIPTQVAAPPQPPAADAGVIASTPRPAPAGPASAFGASPVQAPAAMIPPPVPAVAPPSPPMARPMAPAVRPPPGMAVPAPYGAPMMPAPASFSPYADQVDEPGARAVEVAAMLGSSVVSVKHVMNPRGGKVTGTTWALLGLAAASIVIGLVGFGMGVYNASFNAGKRHEWTEVQKRPSWAFHPRHISLGYDVMLFAGLPLGIALVAAGVMRYRDESGSNPWFRIGQDKGVEYPTSDAPAGSFALVAPRGDDFVFNFTPGMEGDLNVDGQTTPLSELAAQGRATPSTTAAGGLEVQIPQKARIRVKTGSTTFLVTSVPQPKRHPVPVFAGLESRVLLYFVGTAVVVMGFIGLLWTVPPDQESAPSDMNVDENNANTAQMMSQDEPPPPPPDESKDDKDDDSGGTGTAMALDEGKMGKKDSDRAAGQFEMKKNADQEQLARQNALEQARTAGVLGAAQMLAGGTFASQTGTGDISSGFDDMDIQGGLLGDAPGEMNGGFGFGRSGFGPGGGGTGWGTIGTGRYGTIGHGSGTGSGYGIGNGRGGMRGRTAAVPSVRIGQPNSVGDLDKAIIRRYIKRNIQKISYCYEKQLLAHPTLEGTVATQFFISPMGTVPQAQASGVDPEVSSCVASVLKSIEFPKPKGGGGVQVNYPFTFRPTGGGGDGGGD